MASPFMPFVVVVERGKMVLMSLFPVPSENLIPGFWVVWWEGEEVSDPERGSGWRFAQVERAV